MMQKIEEFQKLGKDNLEAMTAAFTTQQKGAQAIASEVADYSKKALEAGSAAVEKLAAVKTLDKAIELQSEFAKSAYEGYVAHATKVGELFTAMAKDAFKPLEGVIAKAQGK